MSPGQLSGTQQTTSSALEYQPQLDTGNGGVIGTTVGLLKYNFDRMRAPFIRRRERKNEARLFNRDRKAALDDWQIQTEYDKPVNQMARLKEAGLNPNLIYGDASAATGSAPTISQNSTPPADISGENKVGNDMAWNPTIGLQMEQLRLATQANQATINLQNAQAIKVLSETDLNKLKLDMGVQSFNNVLESFGLKNKLTEAQTYESWQRQRLSTVQMEKIAADIRFTLDENTRQSIELKLKQDLNEVQVKLLLQQITNAMTENKLQWSRMGLNEKEIEVKNKQIEQMRDQIDRMPREEAMDWIRTIIYGSKK